MNNHRRLVFQSILYVTLIAAFWGAAGDAFPATCDEVLNSCEEAVISQEVTIQICEETSKVKDILIEHAKHQVATTEKELDNQKIATTAGFSLSTVLLLLILL